jgi:hypothetical protein
VPLGWQRQPDDADDDGIVESYEHGRSHLRAARELWELAGDPDRGARIDAVLDRAYTRLEHVISGAEIGELIALLDRLEARLIGAVVDERWKVRPEQLAALRRRTTMFDLDEMRGDTAVHAIGEGMARVGFVREALEHARDEGLELLLD